MSKKWHALSIEQIEKKLKTNAATGLSRKAARSRSAKGTESLYRTTRKRTSKMILELFSDFTWGLLLLSAAILLFFDEVKSGAVILALALAISAFLVFIYHRCHRTTESLDAFFKPYAKVVREGKLFSLDYSRVVVGDVILLEAGDVVGCDARLVRSEDFFVDMRVNKNEKLSLQKNAGVLVNEGEYNARNMNNMVHAGSTVIRGSARAIVTDVGRYTYLGAMIGSVECKTNDELPKELIKAKSFLSRLSMVLLIAILPVCVVGLLMSNIRGGRVYLSSAFLLTVALAASLLVQRAYTAFRYFYVAFLRRSVANSNPAVIRSAASLEELSEIDYIFLLDGATLSEGIYNYSDVIEAGKSEERGENADTYFADLIYLYRNIESRAISAGVSETERYYHGLDEYLNKRIIDTKKISIKYSVFSYSFSIENGEKCESIALTEKGENVFLKVHRTPNVISKCKGAIVDGLPVALSEKDLYDIEGNCIGRMLSDNKLLVFTIVRGGLEYFVGAVCFRENKDPRATQYIQTLEKVAAKVIVFADNNVDMALPDVPSEFYRAPCVRADDFANKNLPVTYHFGHFLTYCGMSEEQIEELISYAHSQGKKVMVVGFFDFAPRVLEMADMFVTCSPVASTLSGYLDEEIKSLEVSGLPSGVTCKQIIKENADILISRPARGKGGLNTLLRSFGFSQWSRQNLNGFVRYSVAVLALRVFAMIVPMLLGNMVLDARHLLFFMAFIDLPVFVMYVLNTSVKFSDVLSGTYELGLKSYIIKESKLLASISIAVLFMFLLPYIPDAFGQQYFYNVEFHFVSVLLLQFALLICIYYEKLGRVKEIVKNKVVLIGTAVVSLLVLVMFIIEPLGSLLGLDRNPIVFVLLSFVPAMIFILVHCLLHRKRKEKKKIE